MLELRKADVKQAKAQLESAQVDLQHPTIRAPIDGVVISRSIDLGQKVAATRTSSCSPRRRSPARPRRTSKVMTLLLASIAAVSRLVGGIGIMNLMRVAERTP